MREALFCPRCGKSIPADAANGLCPTCLKPVERANDVAEQPTIPPADSSPLPLDPVQGVRADAVTLPPTPARLGVETIAPPLADFVSEPAATGARTPLADIPGYEILGELGRGGMGVVYKARHKKLGRLVALKMMLAGGHAGEAELARFRTEAEAIARVKHANIIQIYEIGDHEGKPYFSLEFCAGGSFAQKINGTPMQPKDAARMVELLARGMAAAHHEGVIHRDLKPANVLLTPLPLDPGQGVRAFGTPKITDFGLAKKLDDAGQTQSGAIMGTPSYMAPEQAEGKITQVGPAADIYALGAILYELLTGRPPFKAATQIDTILQVVSNEPVPPSQLQNQMPRDVETICLKCLQKDPAKRYASAEALAEDLGRYQNGEPVQARPTTRWERGVKWAKRRPALAGLLAVSTMSIVGLLVAAGIFWRDAELRAETVQDLALAKGQVAEQQELVGKKRAEVQRLEQLAEQERDAAEGALKTARRVVYAADMQFAHAAWHMNNISRVLTLLERHRPREGEGLENLCDFEWHYLHRLSHRARITLTANAGMLALSPDGRTLAGATVDGKIKLWDVATGKETGAFATPAMVTSLAFAPDGQRLQVKVVNREAIKSANLVKVYEANAKTERLVMEGKAKPSLQMLLHPYQVQAFTLDGRKLGDPENLDPVRHLILRGQAGEVDGKVTVKGHYFHGRCAAVTTDRKTLVIAGTAVEGISASTDLKKPFVIRPQNAVLFWDLVKGEPQKVLMGINDSITALACAPDGKTLAGGTGKTVKIWEVPTGKELLTLTGHTASVSSLTFSHDGKIVVSGSQDGIVKLWDAATGQDLNMPKGHRSPVYRVAMALDGKTLVSADGHGVIKLWDPREAQGPIRLKLDKDIMQLAFASDGKSMMATTDVGTRMHWNLDTGVSQSAGKAASPRYVLSTMSADGNTLATVDFQRSNVKLLDARTSKERRELKGHADTVSHIAFSPNSQILATATRARYPSQAGTVRLWDVGTGEERVALPEWASTLAFSPDGKMLVTGALNGAIKLWDVGTGKERSVLPKQAFYVRSLRFSANGTRLAAVSQDTVKIWDLATGKETFAIHEPGQLFGAVAFSLDGNRLATYSSRVGMTGEVKLWDSVTGREVLSLPLTVTTAILRPDVEQQMAFNPQGTRLAIAERIEDVLNPGKQSDVTIWDTTPASGKAGEAAAAFKHQSDKDPSR